LADLEAARAVRDPRILPKHWMMIAASGVAVHEGKLLLVRDHQGFWAGVGGWVDPGETPEQAILREVREELGVDATVTGHFRPFIAWNVVELDAPVSFLLFPHRLKLASMEFVLDPAEVTDVAWVEPNRLDDYEMLPHARATYSERLDEWLAADR
jgi:8-oxo-dGTP diphosphatase